MPGDITIYIAAYNAIPISISIIAISSSATIRNSIDTIMSIPVTIRIATRITNAICIANLRLE